ncbi:MAG: hypothetical protein RLY95_1564 [Pseudomonadota bacterium]|jgi:hypothetical protein
MDTQNKIKIISVRISVEDWMQINSKAQKSRQAVSAFVRNCAVAKKIVAAADEDTAFEIRRLGRMIKHLYPRISNWSAQEKKQYWDAMSELFAIANRVDGRAKDIEAQPNYALGRAGK